MIGEKATVTLAELDELIQIPDIVLRAHAFALAGLDLSGYEITPEESADTSEETVALKKQ